MTLEKMDQINSVTPCSRGKYGDALFLHAAKLERRI